VDATGVFFAAQPAKNRQNTSPAFLMLSVFALSRLLVDGNLGYRSSRLPQGAGFPIRPDGEPMHANSQRGMMLLWAGR